MKKLCYSFAAMVFILLFCGTSSDAAFSDFTDVSGHWAETTMRMAYNDGIIDGYNQSIFPDNEITMAQATTIICRSLGAEEMADISTLNVAKDAWYYNDIAKAVYLGLSGITAENIEKKINRQDAFFMLAEAFQLVEAKPDLSVLSKFSDSQQISDINRGVIATLVSKGFVQGNGESLRVNAYITRAEFLTILYRITNNYISDSAVTNDLNGGTIIRSDSGLSGIRITDGLWYDCSTSDIRLDDIVTEYAVIRSHSFESLEINGSSHIGRLVIAAQSGDFSMPAIGDSVVETLVIGSGSGSILVSDFGYIEVIGANRTIDIDGTIESIIVSAPSCIINIMSGAQVQKLELLNASGCTVTVNGTVGSLTVNSGGAKITGSGSVSAMTLFYKDTNIGIKCDTFVDRCDYGIQGSGVSINVPDSLKANETLYASAHIENPTRGKECTVTWYVNGEQVFESEFLMGDPIPALTYEDKNSRRLNDKITLSVVVTYTTMYGDKEKISNERTVTLEIPDETYVIKTVNEQISSGYFGNFTLQWALENDLAVYEKEIWVNTNAYTSDTPYLIWINLAFQRVNVFERSSNGWTLMRSCIVGTGANGTDTPIGVWKTTFKEDSWDTYSYTVKPVVRFLGGGYAFHSRLYYPYTDTLSDASIGFPVSHGCIRMYDEDIQFLHQYIPEGTTVIVY